MKYSSQHHLSARSKEALRHNDHNLLELLSTDDPTIQFSERALQCEWRSWVSECLSGKKAVAYTLTYRNMPTNIIQINKDFCRFRNRLNEHYFKSAFRRYRKSLVNFASYDSFNVNPHIHGVCEIPTDRASCNDVRRAIVGLWQLGRVDTADCYNINGWVKYISKSYTKNSISDSFLY